MRVLQIKDETGDKRLSAVVDAYRPDLDPYKEIYKHLHANGELSGLESETAAYVTDHLKKLGYELVTKINGHGLVGILRNGKGRTILLRSELDALPVKEETGLPYASTKQMKDHTGKMVPVMHACGHDMHMASLLAAADLLFACRSKWSGTLLVLFQPAEETVNGALGMVNDGLYDRVPVPDFLLSQHVGGLRAGWRGLSPGPGAASQDHLSVRVFGRGGHASAPEICIDPILTAAYALVRLQSIVSREVPASQPAVITCGTIKAGTQSNVIPDYCDFELDIRTYDIEVRDHIVKSIERIVKAECRASGSEKEPEISLIGSTPPMVNDDDIVRRVRPTFDAHFEEKTQELAAGMGSEDFGGLALDIKKPYAMWGVGGTDQKKWDDAVKNGTVFELPMNHSSKYAPVIDPTMQTCIDSLALGALKMFDA